jgi:NADH-ubiquinone oxidoreductase chain 6
MKVTLMNDLITNLNLEIIASITLLVSILCGIFVIISKNPIVSVLFLIGLFSSIAVYLIILGINFIGLSYLLVYVGAVSILFIFILMLINIRISELTSETNRSIPLAFIVSIAFNYSIIQLLPYSILEYKELDIINLYTIYKKETLKETYFTIINNWDNNITEVSDITSIGNIIYTNYSIWLIIASVILLLAMVGAIVITRKQTDIDIYNYTYNKLDSNVLKSKIKTISIGMIACLGNSNGKDTISYNLKFNMNSILNSILGNKSNNIIADKINNIDIKPDINLVNKVRSNIDFDLINKINTNVDVNFNPTYKFDLIVQKTTQYSNINLESKLLSANYVNWHIDNNIFISIYHMINNYPFHCLLPIIIIIIPVVIAITNPDSTNSTNKASTPDTNTGTDVDNIIVNTGDNTNTNKINTCGAGGSGGEDPNQNKKIFFLLKDKTRIPVPYYIYKEYIDNLEMFIKTRTSLKDKLNLLRNKIGDYISSGGKLSLCNPETGEINEEMKYFLDITRDDRGEIIELIDQFNLWQIGLEESMDKVGKTHPDINDNFNKSIDLLNIGVHEMSYYSLDNDLYTILEENIGIIFSIVDISPFATNFDMAYNPSTSSNTTNPIIYANPADSHTFDQVLSLDNMSALWDTSELIFDTNLDSEVLYDSEPDKWEGDPDSSI